MGYGNLQGTFNIGIVETDVQAIVDGITGYYGRTLTDVDNQLGWLGGYLYDGNSAVNYLNWIANNTGSLQGYLAGWNGGPLTNIDNNTSNIAYNTSNTAYNTGYLSNIDYGISDIRNYLYDWNSYQSAASLLNDIRSVLYDLRTTLWNLNFDGNGRLLVSTN